MNIKINKNYRYVTTLLWYIAFLILASAISYLLVLKAVTGFNLVFLFITTTISFFYILMIAEHVFLKIKQPALIANESGIKDYSGGMGNIAWDNINGIYILNAIPDKELYIDIANLRSVPLRPFSIKKSFFQILSLIISKRYVHKIEISTKQASTLTWANLRTILSHQNKLLSEFPGQSFIKNKELTAKELELLESLELDKRLPIWKAISNLFLDVDIEFLHGSIAQTLANSQYNLQMLNDIYNNEVAPVCYSNLFFVIGKWSGFSEESLKINIIKRLYKQKFRKKKFDFNYFHTFTTREDWQIIIKKVEELRS
ncbi:hypothetical protein [Candidatus Uabimicrobium sp. HlEnr_7]|uniref:DUF7079 family protein n=1 Tax=Candidatus Uabimicrobium helgolandensis TaxID=3095367 RepID=UPI0035583082